MSQSSEKKKINYLYTTHTKDFINDWRKFLINSLGYNQDGDWIKMPNLFFGSAYSYLPFLNYTNFLKKDAENLLRHSIKKKYLIRIIDKENIVYSKNQPVTMRLITAGKNTKQIWDDNLTSKCRNQIRKSKKSKLNMKAGRTKEIIESFYKLYSMSMHNYGAPPLPLYFFLNIKSPIDLIYRVVSFQNTDVAALLEIHDNGLHWIPWAGSNINYKSLNANHYLYWESIKFACKSNVQIFDFGRSPYGGNTYNFKKQWGAIPVGIKLLKNNNINIYKKYSFAQKIWKIIPLPISNLLGGWISLRLLDY